MNKSICKRTKQEKYHLNALGCYTSVDLHISCSFFLLSRVLFYLPPMLTNSLSGFALFNTHLKYVCSPIHAYTHMITHMDTYAHTHRGHLSFPCSEAFLYAPQLPGHNLVTASSTLYWNGQLVPSHFHLKDSVFICICMSSHQHTAWQQWALENILK